MLSFSQEQVDLTSYLQGLNQYELTEVLAYCRSAQSFSGAPIEALSRFLGRDHEILIGMIEPLLEKQLVRATVWEHLVE